MSCLSAWCVCCCHFPSTSDCVTLFYVVATMNPEQLFWASPTCKKLATVCYCNCRLTAVSQITQREISIAQSFRSNRFFLRITNIRFIQNMSFLSTLKDSIIAHQIQNKCLRLTFTSFHNMRPISLYSVIICSLLCVAFASYKWNCSSKSPKSPYRSFH